MPDNIECSGRIGAPEVEPKGKLEAEKPNGICSHKINLSGIEDIDAEVIGWIKEAFNAAG